MDLETATTMIRAKVGEDSGLGATVKFAFDEGVIFIDGAASPNEVSNEDRAAECTIAMALDDFASMIEGELDPTTAFMMGKLKVDGPMAIALKLSGLI